MAVVKRKGVKDTWTYFGHLISQPAPGGIYRLIHNSLEDAIVLPRRFSVECFSTYAAVPIAIPWAVTIVVVRNNTPGNGGFLGYPLDLPSVTDVYGGSVTSLHEFYQDTNQVVFSCTGLSASGQSNSRVTWDNPRNELIRMNYLDKLWITSATSNLTSDLIQQWEFTFDVMA